MARYIDADMMKDDIIRLRRTLDTDKCSNDFACGWIIGVDNMEGVIDRQPTADVVEVKHSHIKWVNRPISAQYATVTDGFGENHHGKVHDRIENNPVGYCGECGKRLDDNFMHYCPNCGARMDGGKG